MCGNRLREIRMNANMTLDQVAKKLNTSHTTISRYENGKRKIDTETLVAFCTLFNVSADYLLGLPKNLPYPDKK